MTFYIVQLYHLNDSHDCDVSNSENVVQHLFEDEQQAYLKCYDTLCWKHAMYSTESGLSRNAEQDLVSFEEDLNKLEEHISRKFFDKAKELIQDIFDMYICCYDNPIYVIVAKIDTYKGPKL